jgi:hypothetical protein
MRRKLTTRLYVFAFIITLLVFSLGLTIGLLVEKERLEEFNQVNLELEVDLKSLQLQQSFIDSGAANCEALNEILEAAIVDVTESMAQVIDYSETSIIDGALFTLNLRDYFLTEIQYLALANEISAQCDTEAVTIIYFYDDNPADVQGNVLSYLKDIFGSTLLVFSFDSNFDEEPMIEVMLKNYGVEEFPTVIVNDQAYYGGISADALEAVICAELDSNHEECLQNVSEI